MRLFLVLTKGGWHDDDRHYVLAENEERVLVYFNNVHVMDIRELKVEIIQ
jgi:hypothetical protein